MSMHARLYVCMHEWMYAYMYVYMYVCIYTYIHTHTYVKTRVSLLRLMCMRACGNACVHTYIYKDMYPHFSPVAGISSHIISDMDWFWHMLMNYLSNARKFTVEVRHIIRLRFRHNRSLRFGIFLCFWIICPQHARVYYGGEACIQTQIHSMFAWKESLVKCTCKFTVELWLPAIILRFRHAYMHACKYAYTSAWLYWRHTYIQKQKILGNGV